MRLIGLAVAVVVTATLVLAPHAVQSQQARPSKVGLLFLGTAGIDWPERAGMTVREGLRELGWVENQNIQFTPLFAGGGRERPETVRTVLRPDANRPAQTE